MKRTKTGRGFSFVEFEDSYGKKCSIQKSSNAEGDYIWIGCDDAEPKVLAREAGRLGINTEHTTGWVDYPIPKNVSLTTRMHINKDQAEDIIAILNEFVSTGEI